MKKWLEKVDFRNLLDQFWGFTLKKVLRIYDLGISWLLFGTKNHKIQGPPVVCCKETLQLQIYSISGSDKSMYLVKIQFALREYIRSKLMLLSLVLKIALFEDLMYVNFAIVIFKSTCTWLTCHFHSTLMTMVKLWNDRSFFWMKANNWPLSLFPRLKKVYVLSFHL